MPDSVFPYPGGKTHLAPWIIEKMPEHKCYVEVFGGSASILVNKPESHTEVYNDLDGDIVQFFKILREREEELIEWLKLTPFARDQHQEWKEQFYSGERADDPVKRAGIFFYLRYSQFASKYRTKSGFAGKPQRNQARNFRWAAGDLKKFADRFRKVQIENLDFEILMNRYDKDFTFFYCDPPYIGGDYLYSHGEFDHERFVNVLQSITGKWMVSYEELPDGLESYYVEEKEQGIKMNKNHDEESRKKTIEEKLVMNYNPEEVTLHSNTSSAEEVDW